MSEALIGSNPDRSSEQWNVPAESTLAAVQNIAQQAWTKFAAGPSQLSGNTELTPLTLTDEHSLRSNHSNHGHDNHNNNNNHGHDNQHGHGGSPLPDNSDHVTASLDGVGKSEVVINATVLETMPDTFNPHNHLAHEHFIIQMDNGDKLFVAHDLTFAPKVPVEAGHKITLKGEWIPEPGAGSDQPGGADLRDSVGVIHWTHDSVTPTSHPFGYIDYEGNRYSHGHSAFPIPGDSSNSSH